MVGWISDCFDLICGTSTGGIIALGLAAGKSAEDIVKFYIDYGADIFPPKTGILKKLRNLKSYLCSSKYKNESLKEKLQELYGDKKLDDSNMCVCIPVVDISDFRGVIIKTTHNKNLTDRTENCL